MNNILNYKITLVWSPWFIIWLKDTRKLLSVIEISWTKLDQEQNLIEKTVASKITILSWRFIIVAGYRPHLFGISESCFKKEHDISDIEIPDYTVYLSKTLDNPNLNVSRLAVYVHKDVINPKLRLDLMNENFSSIWLEIRLPRQKSILVGNAYRDWQYLGQNDDSSIQINAQFERFLTQDNKSHIMTTLTDDLYLLFYTFKKIQIGLGLIFNPLPWLPESALTK